MNEVVNTFLLAGGKFMLEMRLRQPGFTYSSCGPFTKNKDIILILKDTGHSRYIYQIKLDKGSYYQKILEIIRKFEKRKVYSSFIDNIWGADFADMQLPSKFNKGFRYLLFVVDIYIKYAWVVLLNQKKVLQLLMLFKSFQMSLVANQTKYK